MLIINLLIVFAAYIIMEGVAWFAHKFIMHGPLWSWHKDHHQPRPGKHFQKNDLFFLVFATPGITSMLIGIDGFAWPFWFGLGIALYGLTYFLVHDLLIHRRRPWFGLPKNRYFLAVQRAHRAHHRNPNREGGQVFGMLFFPLQYWK